MAVNDMGAKPFQNPSTKTMFGHPQGVFLVSGTEMWERFSYYGLGVLLVLFLTAPVLSGGFGWDKAQAVQIYGIYSGAAFCAPAIGGWIASRYTGERRSIVIGGMVIIGGHFLLGATGYMPWIASELTGIAVEEIIIRSGVAVGNLALSPDVEAALSQTAHDMGYFLRVADHRMLNIAYLSKGWGLLLGLGFIVIGTGFMKGPISSIVGKLYERDDDRREMGFTFFMVGIWLGALGSSLIVGTIGENVGWHMGLASAGIGMTFGMMIYLLKQQELLGDVGKLSDMQELGLIKGDEKESKKKQSFYLTVVERPKMMALAGMALFTIIFSIAYNQYGGVWNLIIYNNIDRTIGGFEVPAAWYLAITTVSFIILAPLSPKLYRWLEGKGISLDVVDKQVLGLISIGLAYALLWILGKQHDANPEALLNGGWIVGAYLLFAIGDIFIWPPQINAVSTLAPERYQSFIIGLWYVTYGLGAIIAGQIGAKSYEWGLGNFSAAIFIGCITSAVILFALRTLLRRLMI